MERAVTPVNCMKCGAEIKGEQVFCDDCLTQMARFPVRPNVVVQLPPKQDSLPARKRKPVKKDRDLAEQNRHLRSQVRWLSLLLAVALLGFGLMAALLLRFLDQRDGGEKPSAYSIVDVSRETF